MHRAGEATSGLASDLRDVAVVCTSMYTKRFDLLSKLPAPALEIDVSAFKALSARCVDTIRTPALKLICSRMLEVLSTKLDGDRIGKSALVAVTIDMYAAMIGRVLDGDTSKHGFASLCAACTDAIRRAPTVSLCLELLRLLIATAEEMDEDCASEAIAAMKVYNTIIDGMLLDE